MSQDTDKKRSKRERIARLRERVKRLPDYEDFSLDVRGILQGILDLLEDEL